MGVSVRMVNIRAAATSLIVTTSDEGTSPREKALPCGANTPVLGDTAVSKHVHPSEALDGNTVQRRGGPRRPLALWPSFRRGCLYWRMNQDL